MNRKTGAIPPVIAEKYPHRMIIFDTEAYRSPPVNGVELQTLKLGVAVFIELDVNLQEVKREYADFTTLEGLIDFIEWHTRKDKTLYIYAHNLRYDLQLSGLYQGLISADWKASLFVVESPPTFIRISKGRKSIMMVDTFNYWQFSLSKMGDQLGLPKLTMPDDTSPDQEWFIYCKRDVEVLSNYIISFIHFLDDNNLLGLGVTLASQAFKSFRYRFMRDEIILHNRTDVTLLERASYYGGRCEAFYIGSVNSQPYYKVDVNSMYPYVMRDREYPVELLGYSENVPLSLLENHINDRYCLAECTIETEDPIYAYVRDGKLIFPTGSFRAFLHQAELVIGLNRGHIKEVIKLAIYEKAKIFTPYVDYFYNLKLSAEREGNQITRHQAKIFLNSLYGKFGQRQTISKIVPIDECDHYERITGYSETLKRHIEVNYIGNMVEVRYKEGEAFYSFPAIAGAVTAYARVYLWELIEKAGVNNVYYLDTDSLILSLQGYENITPYLDPHRLGSLKLEGQADRMTIHGAKDYIFGGDIKVKGVPKTAKKLSEGVWEYEQFRGAKTWLSDNMDQGVKVYTRIKVRRNVYDKGVITSTGRVLPHALKVG